jgi:signal transduction histidine kinase
MEKEFVAAGSDHHTIIDELLHVTSHQLRGPVCTMMGLLQLVNRGILTEDEYEEVFDHLSRCLSEMDKSSRDVVNIAQILKINLTQRATVQED